MDGRFLRTKINQQSYYTMEFIIAGSIVLAAILLIRVVIKRVFG
ncbi:hypothetical protein Belba_0294 [Belliella baltica DSM 15883]|uniref:Uncharacterized protein n=1 Tax=Belliella baltica (strain DSM 15883 / CIP 108006 / LMG 21964 / BA134) TaxID=866536 RepID=I3Z140_BELBD|nr:hypothetical protein Belba_0294 [Belliella baltica DSM 15883]